TLDRLGDPTAARLHRAAAERMLEEETANGPTENGESVQSNLDACEIRSASDED
ncbi:hypothetical protein GTW73_03795, partial [Streptomyces sp. SID4982]|nr:hypothetical protein [Streptomyces sp. SID4982]